MPRYTPAPPRPASSSSTLLRGSVVAYRYLKVANGQPANTVFEPPTVDNTVRSRSGSTTLSAATRTPGYFAKVSKGSYIPPLPLSGSRTEIRHGVGVVFQDYGSVFRKDVGNEPFSNAWACLPPSSWSAFDTALPNRALINCRLKLKEQSVNLAQAFNERRQTAKLLSETLQKVTRSVSALRRGDLRSAVRALDLPFSATKRLRRDQTAGSNWLALQYGWKPLLSDLYGSAELLRSRDAADPGRYRLFAKASAKSEASSYPIYDGIVGSLVGPRYEVSWDNFGVVKKAKVRLDYNLNEQVVARLASRVGFLNPLTLAWEATPFSFVVDWFLPIGNYLNQLDATTGLSFMGGSLTQRWEIICDTRVVRNVPRVFPQVDVSFGLKSKAWDRSVYTVEPFPNRPTFKDPFTGVHLANAAALLSVLKRSTT